MLVSPNRATQDQACAHSSPRLSKMPILPHCLCLGRKGSPSIVLPPHLASYESIFIPSSPPHTPPYPSRFGLLSAPFRRGTDFQHLRLLKAPHPKHCRTGFSSYQLHSPLTPPIYQCTLSASLSTTRTQLLPVAWPMNS